MKRILSCILIAVLLFSCAFSAHGAEPSDPEEECTCACHLMLSMRDSLLQEILDKTIDGQTLVRILWYYVQLFTWRVLGIQQYCACGARHY